MLRLSYCSSAGGAGFCFFFFNDTATTEIYTLSLHDALPICTGRIKQVDFFANGAPVGTAFTSPFTVVLRDRKSTRLNSSHSQISYAVFCLKKKKNYRTHDEPTRPARVTLQPRAARHSHYPRA